MSSEIPATGRKIEVRLATNSEFEQCLAIRLQVFVEEQGVPIEEENDGLDGEAVHWLAHAGDVVVGTARVRRTNGVAKAERVAVRSQDRGRGVGRALMRAIEAWARRERIPRILLHAQESAVDFYLALEYRIEGESFEEAGIQHRAMSKQP